MKSYLRHQNSGTATVNNNNIIIVIISVALYIVPRFFRSAVITFDVHKTGFPRLYGITHEPLEVPYDEFDKLYFTKDLFNKLSIVATIIWDSSFSLTIKHFMSTIILQNPYFLRRFLFFYFFNCTLTSYFSKQYLLHFLKRAILYLTWNNSSKKHIPNI